MFCNRKVSNQLGSKCWQQPFYTPVLGSHVCRYCFYRQHCAQRKPAGI